MLSVLQNYSLKSLNTFGFDVKADFFIVANSPQQLIKALEWGQQQEVTVNVLGGGSNILFEKDVKGLVISPDIQGIELTNEDAENVLVRVGAGVEWDDLVEYAVNKGWGGLENLSLIPGKVGASPIQNIGAYGVEAKDTIALVEGIFRDTFEPFAFKAEECDFGYRDSVFKRRLKGKVVITHVTFRLKKNPSFVVHYGNLEEELQKLGGVNLLNIRRAVISIRNAKLPDPKEIGNAGSFFKNPVVDTQLVEKFANQYERVPTYPVSEEQVKLPAGWLIEQCGWKGKRVGNVGVHAQQALVLVNYGGGTGSEVLSMAKSICQAVHEKFSVQLEMEVNVV